ncbi:MAG: glutamate synthase large subunit [Hyphomicrobiales bacterium]|nr:glutamate synthase large subunit [Hyphomicrobiales bacterium]MCY4049576.1 glutamate synthase large subunit [Hyphomicrobiales bacterium]
MLDRDNTQARPDLYDPAFEHDACGLGFIADIQNRKSHEIVEQGLEILSNLVHRGAVGADPKASDGVGILVQIPDAFLRREMDAQGVNLPAQGEYGVGVLFLPPDDVSCKTIENDLADIAKEEGLALLGWRDVPTDNRNLGESVRSNEPVHRQCFLSAPDGIDQDALERKLFVLRKRLRNLVAGRNDPQVNEFFYVVSMSSRTMVYKGMLMADKIAEYYPDIADKNFSSGIALVHQRFSTNTFPAWSLAHPYRMICHNGEINTLRGNVNWMAARGASMHSQAFGDDLKKIFPIIPEGRSDSACFDNALELMVRAGYSLPHAMMLLIPEAWRSNPLMDAERRAFYQYHAAVMEPWDGPAAVAFTDGRVIGATLDRNGLRPARYVVTEDGQVVLSSEAGVLPLDESRITHRWRLQPGKMLLIDLEAKRIIGDEEAKRALTSAHPWQERLGDVQIALEDVTAATIEENPRSNASLLDLQQAFGYTKEDLKFLLSPMAETGQEGVGSMGNDTPLSSLSNHSKLLYTYFKQNFAQVTNPPIDPIREELVMSLTSFLGARPNLLDPCGESQERRLMLKQPILSSSEMQKVRAIGRFSDSGLRVMTLDISYAIERGVEAMSDMLTRLCDRAEKSVLQGSNIIILSDRLTSASRIAMPALLATSAVHHHLIRKGLRTSVGIVVETGEAREVHHFCCLAGYGAEAVHPYLAFETVEALCAESPTGLLPEKAKKRLVKALNKGILKVMSKMGISTYQSYCGAQIFDAVGLSTEFIKDYFTGTHSAVEGLGLETISREAFIRHRQAFGNVQILRQDLDVGGEYAFRMRGEAHVWSPDAVRDLQHATRGGSDDDYQRFAERINQQSESLMTLRGLFRIKDAAEMGVNAVPLDEVEPASEIVKRFATGAMSFGSISREAHTTLAVAMNRIGGKSNTGEGGEEADRFRPLDNGDSMRSAIKQVASGRFGVTAEYLVNADMIQIKMAQGAKPGEGGQLPGHKVDATIARVRFSTPGVGLISPPPHHDIYSIEDLAQLIFDLKNVAPHAAISVKLVSELGVGTVAAGVCKARADHVTISGFEGGTGASPLTSIKHAGSPWEIGLAETHQTLVRNRLRGRIAVQVDGGLRTGRDVVVGALLGADEFGFSTAPLISAGCIMMRKCHLNTCPVGIATQDPQLRKKFTGKPEHVIRYFFYVAEEIRALMASMGVRRFDDMVGCSEYLDQARAIDHWKARGLDFSRLLARAEAIDIDGQPTPIFHSQTQKHPINDILDRTLIKDSSAALEKGENVIIEAIARNTDRSIGAMLSGEIAKRYGHAGLPDGTITVKFKGTAGQSFGAFAARGLTLKLEGAANDYVGKGLSGGKVVVAPSPQARLNDAEAIAVGNTSLYGAIQGECYIRGVAGERFGVRNSGAIAVIEGAGDHCCEYMTGGVVVVLGATGRNFAAGMSGGIAYVLDEQGDFDSRCNLAMVELEPITEEDVSLEETQHQGGDLEGHGLVDVFADLSRGDAERLHFLVRQHFEATSSPKAKEILDAWESYLPRFRKIMPVEYRRALQERSRGAQHNVMGA